MRSSAVPPAPAPAAAQMTTPAEPVLAPTATQAPMMDVLPKDGTSAVSTPDEMGPWQDRHHDAAAYDGHKDHLQYPWKYWGEEQEGPAWEKNNKAPWERGASDDDSTNATASDATQVLLSASEQAPWEAEGGNDANEDGPSGTSEVSSLLDEDLLRPTADQGPEESAPVEALVEEVPSMEAIDDEILGAPAGPAALAEADALITKAESPSANSDADPQHGNQTQAVHDMDATDTLKAQASAASSLSNASREVAQDFSDANAHTDPQVAADANDTVDSEAGVASPASSVDITAATQPAAATQNDTNAGAALQQAKQLVAKAQELKAAADAPATKRTPAEPAVVANADDAVDGEAGVANEAPVPPMPMDASDGPASEAATPPLTYAAAAPQTTTEDPAPTASVADAAAPATAQPIVAAPSTTSEEGSSDDKQKQWGAVEKAVKRARHLVNTDHWDSVTKFAEDRASGQPLSADSFAAPAPAPSDHTRSAQSDAEAAAYLKDVAEVKAKAYMRAGKQVEPLVADEQPSAAAGPVLTSHPKEGHIVVPGKPLVHGVASVDRVANLKRELIKKEAQANDALRTISKAAKAALQDNVEEEEARERKAKALVHNHALGQAKENTEKAKEMTNKMAEEKASMNSLSAKKKKAAKEMAEKAKTAAQAAVAAQKNEQAAMKLHEVAQKAATQAAKEQAAKQAEAAEEAKTAGEKKAKQDASIAHVQAAQEKLQKKQEAATPTSDTAAGSLMPVASPTDSEGDSSSAQLQKQKEVYEEGKAARTESPKIPRPTASKKFMQSLPKPSAKKANLPPWAAGNHTANSTTELLGLSLHNAIKSSLDLFETKPNSAAAPTLNLFEETRDSANQDVSAMVEQEDDEDKRAASAFAKSFLRRSDRTATTATGFDFSRAARALSGA